MAICHLDRRWPYRESWGAEQDEYVETPDILRQRDLNSRELRYAGIDTPLPEVGMI